MTVLIIDRQLFFLYQSYFEILVSWQNIYSLVYHCYYYCCGYCYCYYRYYFNHYHYCRIYYYHYYSLHTICAHNQNINQVIVSEHILEIFWRYHLSLKMGIFIPTSSFVTKTAKFKYVHNPYTYCSPTTCQVRQNSKLYEGCALMIFKSF